MKPSEEPSALESRAEFYAEEQKWDKCVEAASELVRRHPHRLQGWIYIAHALHALGKTELAYTYLTSAIEVFPREWRLPYNLACYCSQLGRFEEAAKWLAKATVMDEQMVMKHAITDPDLFPLFDSVGSARG